jgi:sulfite reductase (NADPH) flavoprotein alpha-component
MTEIPVLPASAPFSPAQRAWLNGFFAGLFSRSNASIPHGEPTSDFGELEVVVSEDEPMPWHDPSLSLDERLNLTEDKPQSRKLMAAMAQLDCGACGYICQTYAEAIASGEEKDLTRCAPGGRDTAKKLKELVALVPADQITVKGKSPTKPRSRRENHFEARLLKNTRLNAPTSTKDTRHIVFDLHGTGLSYKAGDALGVIPENCPDTVGWIIEALDASGAEAVTSPAGESISLHEALLRHYTITAPSPDLIKLLAEVATDEIETKRLAELAADDGPGIPAGEEIVDVLQRFPSAQPSVSRFFSTLVPIRPRLYSISSSPNMNPDEVHLTVGVVRYVNGQNRQCKGVCSTYLAERLQPGRKAKVFVHASQTFAPPIDPAAPMIMVGPGTGIAPFRAFLQDRVGSGGRGKNWLFFGDQRREQDFLYRAEIESWLLDGTLTRLDVAFSRDQKEKVYVQDRILEKSREIWAWLQQGAYFYVCGDAKRMAKDVDEALKKIVAEQGNMSPDAAAEFVAKLARDKRYARDVY